MGHIKLDSANFISKYKEIWHDNYWRNKYKYVIQVCRLFFNSNDSKLIEKFLLDLKITQYPWLLTTGWKHLDFYRKSCYVSILLQEKNVNKHFNWNSQWLDTLNVNFTFFFVKKKCTISCWLRSRGSKHDLNFKSCGISFVSWSVDETTICHPFQLTRTNILPTRFWVVLA